ncbi:hypothetical protein PV336_16365 [Streptomyces sp. MI02-2A]|nr:hypothetical protein [Streptomyces sp. MI02-2A]MDX3260796.1 hypothetical protein [Streptomyces sp. MI02-2A]
MADQNKKSTFASFLDALWMVLLRVAAIAMGFAFAHWLFTK